MRFIEWAARWNSGLPIPADRIPPLVQRASCLRLPTDGVDCLKCRSSCCCGRWTFRRVVSFGLTRSSFWSGRRPFSAESPRWDLNRSHPDESPRWDLASVFFFKVALLPVVLGVSWSSANPSDLITSVVTTPLSTFNLRITEPDGWTRPTGSAADGRSVYGHISIKPPPVDGRRRDVQVCLWTRYDPSWRWAVNRFKRKRRQRRLAADLRSKRICGRTRRRIGLHSKESWSSVSRAIDWCVTTFNSNWIKLTS